MKKLPQAEVKEQLYIDAGLNFAIKHPLNWQIVKIPVSSPEYKADKVFWQIDGPRQQDSIVGNMLIQRLPAENVSLPDRLSHFLESRPELTSGQVDSFDHSAGHALKLLGHDKDRGRLTIALRGQQQDFIISLSCLNNQFIELLPIFQDIMDSFTEIIRPDISSQTQKK